MHLNASFYIERIFTDLIELSGDRICEEDSSLLAGIACLNESSVTVIAQMKGTNIEEQEKYNFSMTKPSGFRKALRLMKQAEKFNRPIICFVDTVGADPSVSSEENGQVSAISSIISEMLLLKVPIITIYIGDGYSGGALALSVSNKIALLETSTMAVVSPKACAEILLKDKNDLETVKAKYYHNAMELYKQGIVDQVFTVENNDFNLVASVMRNYLIKEIKLLSKLSVSKLINQRKKKFRNMV